MCFIPDTGHTYRYIHIGTDTYNTYTYIHIHTPGNQRPEGVLSSCCGRSRRLCAALPTQIIWDGARGGLAEREMRVECILAALGVHFGPPQRVLRARVRKNGCWFMSPMAEKSGRPPDQGCPEWGPRGAAPAGGLWGELCWHPCLSGPIRSIHTAYMSIHTIHV